MPIVQVRNVSKTFYRDRGPGVRAVNDVSFSIEEGETLALIGESGSGKSTVGRLMLRLIEADDGEIAFDGHDVRRRSPEELRRLRAAMQVVFQEPYESLNPRMSIGAIVGEPLEIHERGLSGRQRAARVAEMLDEVGLDPALAGRRPGALSGGQQQRVGIARALITRPRFIVLDEPTSSLDLSVQGQILRLLQDLQKRLKLTYLYISHDLSTVSYIAHRVAVMYLGQIREIGSVDDVVNRPQDPYTRALLNAFLSPDPTVRTRDTYRLSGEIPSPTQVQRGCFLYSRCPSRIEPCASTPADLRQLDPGHEVRCIRAPLSQPLVTVNPELRTFGGPPRPTQKQQA